MSDETPLTDDVQREALIRKLRNLMALTECQRCAIADGWEREARWRKVLEAEVAELRDLRDLVTEADRVKFARGQDGEYPIEVWGGETIRFGGHPWTWGVRGEAPTQDDIGRALASLRALRGIVAEEANDGTDD